MTDLVLVLVVAVFALRGALAGAGRPLIELLGIALAAAIAVGAGGVLAGSPAAGVGVAVIYAGVVVVGIAAAGSLVAPSSPSAPDRIGGLAVGVISAAAIAAGIVLAHGSTGALGVTDGVTALDPLGSIIEGSTLLRTLRDELLPALGLLRGY